MIYTDENILAYINAKMPPDERKKFEAHLSSDILLQKRVEAISEKFGIMKSEYDDLLQNAPATPDFLRAEPSANDNQPKSLTRIVASFAALMIAGMIGYSFSFTGSNSDTRNWTQYVATYQALYATPTLDYIKPDATRENAEIARASASLGKKFERDRLNGPQQIDYKRAQILSFKGRPLIQFTYLSKIGAPIALCVIKMEKGVDKGPVYSIMEEQQTALWVKDGYGYMLIGGKDRNIIKTASENFYKIL